MEGGKRMRDGEWGMGNEEGRGDGEWGMNGIRFYRYDMWLEIRDFFR